VSLQFSPQCFVYMLLEKNLLSVPLNSKCYRTLTFLHEFILSCYCSCLTLLHTVRGAGSPFLASLSSSFPILPKIPASPPPLPCCSPPPPLPCCSPPPLPCCSRRQSSLSAHRRPTPSTSANQSPPPPIPRASAGRRLGHPPSADPRCPEQGAAAAGRPHASSDQLHTRRIKSAWALGAHLSPSFLPRCTGRGRRPKMQ
jgi:hypothetical protein